QPHRRLALSRPRRDEDEISRRQTGEYFAGVVIDRLASGGRYEQAPSRKTFLRGDAVERGVKGDAFVARKQLCPVFQATDGDRRCHRKNLLLRADRATPPHA